jgi:TldD protein
MLGTYRVGSPLLNVTANRSHPGGVATVKWDDESVEPDEFTLVKDGVLADFQTTREQAAWLAPYYNKTGTPVHSHGCASTDSALDVTLQNVPNLQLMPGAKAASFDDLVADTEKGLALMNVSVHMDTQQLTGFVLGTMREINKGKLGRFVIGGALDFRTPEFWKSLTALGGSESTRWFGQRTEKGEPSQRSYYSVGAVPAKFKDAAIIDFMRKA